jgi:hypothetical protein
VYVLLVPRLPVATDYHALAGSGRIDSPTMDVLGESLVLPLLAANHVVLLLHGIGSTRLSYLPRLYWANNMYYIKYISI